MVKIFVILQYSEAVRTFKSCCSAMFLCNVVQRRVRGPYQRGLSAQQQVALESLKTSDTFSSSSKSILFQFTIFKVDTFLSSTKSIFLFLIIFKVGTFSTSSMSLLFFNILKVDTFFNILKVDTFSSSSKSKLFHHLQSRYFFIIFKVSSTTRLAEISQVHITNTLLLSSKWILIQHLQS